jgi:hypothetical protein
MSSEGWARTVELIGMAALGVVLGMSVLYATLSRMDRLSRRGGGANTPLVRWPDLLPDPSAAPATGHLPLPLAPASVLAAVAEWEDDARVDAIGAIAELAAANGNDWEKGLALFQQSVVPLAPSRT